MADPILLTSSVIGAICGAFLNGIWNRRAAKKIPKTQMRADAYRDFVAHMVSTTSSSGGASPNTLGNPAVIEINSRLLLFGESSVVCSVSKFLNQHKSLSTNLAIEDFVAVVCEMRKSLLTGHGEGVAESIRSLLRSNNDPAGEGDVV